MLIVDGFAGGGGASTGIEWATGQSPTIAIDHDPEAIAMHAINHPSTEHSQAAAAMAHHLAEGGWQLDPRTEREKIEKRCGQRAARKARMARKRRRGWA